MSEFTDKVASGWHKAITWVDGHPKITLIAFCVVVAGGALGWIV